MTADLTASVRMLLGTGILSTRRLHGGDLSDVTHLILDDGREVVAKTGPHVAIEGRMLAALDRAGAPVPAVIGGDGAVLLIEYLPETLATPDGWRRIGAALRRMHDTIGERYGWPEDYAFGGVLLHNTPNDDWPRFWAEHRLCAALSEIPVDLANRLDTLARRLSDLLPAAPPAALLHGDLWAGNLLFTDGPTFLIDPACYFGDAEVDLAMLHLFGSPGGGFAEAYGALAPGWQARRPIYQLWPALVHLRLFGSGYRAMVDRLLRQIGF